MPRYFLNIREDGRFVPDEEGMEFEDLESAKHEALESCREMVIEWLKGHQKFTGLMVEIVDESGKILDAIIARDQFG